MTPAELLEQDRLLRMEVDALLERHGLLDILRRYGTVHLSGSYAMQLMTWRDLDIYLAMSDLSAESFMELGQRLVKALVPRKASYIDHIHFPATENLPGLYWGIYTGMLSQGGWKIDLWGVDSASCSQRLQHVAAIRANLDHQKRINILSIKNAVCRDPRYRDTITSQHIYDAVLKHGITTIDTFWLHINQQSS